MITDRRQWWKEVSSRIYESWILKPETEIMKETPWSRIRRQDSVDKEFLEIVGNGKPKISVQNWHSRILVRAILRGRKKCIENPKTQRQKTQWKNVSTAVRGLPQRNLHQFILWKVAPSRTLVLQDQEWLSFWGKVVVCTSSGWWTS